MPKLWNFRDSQTGALVEEAPQNPWLSPPQGIAEQIQHGEAMQVIREQLMRDLRAAGRLLDLKPEQHEAERLQRLYAVDKTVPSGEVLLGEVAQAAARMRDYTWKRILDRLEHEHGERAGADEAEMAAIASGEPDGRPSRESSGIITTVRDALRRDEGGN